MQTSIYHHLTLTEAQRLSVIKGLLKVRKSERMRQYNYLRSGNGDRARLAQLEMERVENLIAQL